MHISGAVALGSGGVQRLWPNVPAQLCQPDEHLTDVASSDQHTVIRFAATRRKHRTGGGVYPVAICIGWYAKAAC
jgi:hypothetical protein